MTVEYTTMRPEGIRYIRATNSALMSAKLRAIVNKAATLPSGTGDDSKSKAGDPAPRGLRLAEKRKQAEEKKMSEDTKRNPDAMRKTDAAKKTARDTPPGRR
jgi:hypothetical protein